MIVSCSFLSTIKLRIIVFLQLISEINFQSQLLANNKFYLSFSFKTIQIFESFNFNAIRIVHNWDSNWYGEGQVHLQ